jgi:hypothetical protein
LSEGLLYICHNHTDLMVVGLGGEIAQPRALTPHPQPHPLLHRTQTSDTSPLLIGDNRFANCKEVWGGGEGNKKDKGGSRRKRRK